MAGYVYACCREGCFTHVKIGFTTQNPNVYCHKFSRTLTPLQILSIKPFSNARLAEANVFHILNARRVHSKHEIFDLSAASGIDALHCALAHASAFDRLGDLPVPNSPTGDRAHRKRPKRRREVNPEDMAIAREAKRIRHLVRARAEEERRQELKTERQKRVIADKEVRLEDAASALTTFISEKCHVAQRATVNAKSFLDTYNRIHCLRVKQGQLKKLMQVRGFITLLKNVSPWIIR